MIKTILEISYNSGEASHIGGALSIAVLLGGAVSGGAFNPAVAIAYVASGKISSSDVVPYIVAQIAGALVAFELVKRMIKAKK